MISRGAQLSSWGVPQILTYKRGAESAQRRVDCPALIQVHGLLTAIANPDLMDQQPSSLASQTCGFLGEVEEMC